MHRSVLSLLSASAAMLLLGSWIVSRDGAGADLEPPPSELREFGTTALVPCIAHEAPVLRNESERDLRVLARLVDAQNGSARSGVRVAFYDEEPATCLDSLDPERIPTPRLRVASDARGWVVIPGEIASRGWLDIEGPDVYGPGLVHCEAREAEGATAIAVEAAGRARVRIEAPPGRTVEGARVFLLPGLASYLRNEAEPRILRSVAVDARGEVEIGGLEPGTGWRALVRAEGLTATFSARFDVQAGECTRCVVTLAAPNAVRGGVLDPDGLPVAGARVVLTRNVEGGEADPLECVEPPFFEQKSGADGTFCFHGIAAGSIQLEASSHGFAPSGRESLDLIAGLDVDGISLELRAGRNLRGNIVDAAGRSVADAGVTLYAIRRVDDRRFVDHSMSLSTDAGGSFELRDLEVPSCAGTDDDRLEISVACTGRPDERFELPFPADGMLPLVLPPLHCFELRVVSAATGEPVPEFSSGWKRHTSNCRMISERWEVRAPLGLCSLRGDFAAGDVIEIHAPGFDVVRWTATQEALEAGEHTLALVPRVALSGVVVDDAEHAIAGAEVLWHGSAVPSATGADGGFVLAACLDAETWLEIRKEGYAPHCRWYGIESGTPLRCVLERGGTLRGRVLDATGKPLSGRAVVVIDEDASERRLTLTGTDGAYAFQHLPEADVRVGLIPDELGLEFLRRFQSCSYDTTMVWNQQTTIYDLVEERSVLGSIRGRIVDARGRPLAGVELRWSQESWERLADTREEARLASDAEGRFAIGDLPEGRYELQCWRPVDGDTANEDSAENGDSYAMRPVELGPGEHAEIEIAFVSRTIEGRVVDAATGALVPCPTISASWRAEIEASDARGYEIECDPYGRFVAEDLAPGHWSFTADVAEDSGYAPASAEISIDRDGPLPVLELRVPRAGSLEIRVRSAEDGAPIEDASVHCFRSACGTFGYRDAEELTEPLLGLAPGEIEVVAYAEDRPFVTQRVDIEAGRTTRIELAPALGALVRFQVQNEQALGVTGASIHLRLASETSVSAARLDALQEICEREVDDCGIDETRALPAGRYVATARRGTQVSLDTAFEVPARGAVTVPLVLR